MMTKMNPFMIKKGILEYIEKKMPQCIRYGGESIYYSNLKTFLECGEANFRLWDFSKGKSVYFNIKRKDLDKFIRKEKVKKLCLE